MNIEQFVKLADSNLTRSQICEEMKISSRTYYRLVQKTGKKARSTTQVERIVTLLEGKESLQDIATICDTSESYVKKIQNLKKGWVSIPSPDLKESICSLFQNGMRRKTIARHLSVDIKLVFDLTRDLKAPELKPWSQEDHDFLMALKEKNVSFENIANILGRTLSACRQRYYSSI